MQHEIGNSLAVTHRSYYDCIDIAIVVLRMMSQGQIMIRNLDATVIEALRRRAAACGTSMEEQARRALTRAVGLEREAATLDDLRARPWPRLGMTVIVDASVALKWVIEEDGS